MSQYPDHVRRFALRGALRLTFYLLLGIAASALLYVLAALYLPLFL